MQQQHGADDCELSAIAFGFHLALRGDLTKVMLNQSEMQSHLVNYFQEDVSEPFPHRNIKCIPKELYAPCHFVFVVVDLFCGAHTCMTVHFSVLQDAQLP